MTTVPDPMASHNSMRTLYARWCADEEMCTAFMRDLIADLGISMFVVSNCVALHEYRPTKAFQRRKQ
jgi:hypothetical protein